MFQPTLKDNNSKRLESNVFYVSHFSSSIAFKHAYVLFINIEKFNDGQTNMLYFVDFYVVNKKVRYCVEHMIL